jgi:hypothetical protein
MCLFICTAVVTFALPCCASHAAREILLGKSLRLKHGWVAVVNRGQADINKKMTMSEARGRELEFFKGVDQYRWGLLGCRAAVAACMGKQHRHHIANGSKFIMLALFGILSWVRA